MLSFQVESNSESSGRCSLLTAEEYHAGSLSSENVLSLAPKAFAYSQSLGIAREYGMCIKATSRYTVPNFESIFEI